jgi:uncharacterized protein YqcC (DUF446 family)
MRREIKRLLVDKATIVTPANTCDLIEHHGCFEKGKQFTGALGGLLLQWYFVINAILKIYNKQADVQKHYAKLREDASKEDNKQAVSPRELLLEHCFVPFMLSTLKELKTEFLQFLIMPKLQAVIDEIKVPRKPDSDQYDFSKLNMQQYIQFRHAFVEERLCNPIYAHVENPKAMDMILNVICMVLCNRVPKGLVPFKMDQVVNKIRLVSVPKGLELERREVLNEQGEVTAVFEKNTTEKALVRILVPRRKLTVSEIDVEERKREAAIAEKEQLAKAQAEEKEKKAEEDKDKDAEGEKPAEEDKKEAEAPKEEEKVEEEPAEDLHEKMIEQDQDDKAIQMNNRVTL